MFQTLRNPTSPTREAGGGGFIQHPAELTGDPEAGLLALHVAHEFVVVALAASVVEDLALLLDGVVEVALDRRPARPLVHREQAGAWKQRQEQQNRPVRVGATAQQRVRPTGDKGGKKEKEEKKNNLKKTRKRHSLKPTLPLPASATPLEKQERSARSAKRHESIVQSCSNSEAEKKREISFFFFFN